MAKVFVILLTFIYVCSATGATVHLDYCCGELRKLEVLHPNETPDPADCPGGLTHHENEKDDTACCTDDSCDPHQAGDGHCRHLLVEAKKTSEEHLRSADTQLTKIYPLELLVFALPYVAHVPLDVHEAAMVANHAPPSAFIPLFIQHCTYRI